MGSLVGRISDSLIRRASEAVEYAPLALFHPTTAGAD